MSLKTKIFLGIGISFLIVFSIFSIYTFNETSKTIIQKENEMLETIGKAINMKMEQQIETSEISALSLANNIEIQKLFADRNRDVLTKMLVPAFDSISDRISQVQFHLPDSTSFLRLHKPEKYGDSLRDFRFTVNEANEKEKIVRGLEKGVAGFGFRVVVPISYNGTHIGTVEYGSEFGDNFIEQIKTNYGGEYFIYQFEDGNNEANMIASTLDDDIWDIEIEDYIEKVKNNETLHLLSSDRQYHISLIPFKDYKGIVSGYFKVINDRSALLERLGTIKKNGLILTFALSICLLTIVYLFLRYSFKPILELTDITKKVSLGDLTQKITVKSKDEIGILAESFNVMTSNLRDIISKSAEVSEDVAATSQELSASSEEVTAASEQVVGIVSELTNSSHKQATSIEEANTSVNNISNKIKDVAINVDNINSSTHNTLESAKKGILASENAVNNIESLKISTEETSKKIYRLHESSKEIEKIVNSISTIAEQTNLLALNAAIEAARAGESGKGFSVVANEVRKLAEESSYSSEQIENLILNIQKDIENIVKSIEQNAIEVESSVQIVNQSSHNFSDILNEIDAIASQIKEVTDLINGVSNDAMETNHNFDIVSNITNKTLISVREVADGAEEQTSAMEEIAASTMNLATLANELKNSISKFKY